MPTYKAQTTNPKSPDWARQTSRLCGAIDTLRTQLNDRHPDRDRTSDGFIGDARHLAAGTGSDHNPWWKNLVRAGDFDVDGINAPWFVEQLRLAGRAGDPRLCDGGYIILNGHITTPDFSLWVPYTGDPHTGHAHVSASRTSACDYTGPWDFLSVAEPAQQSADPGPVRPATAGSDWTGPDAVGSGLSFRADLGNNGPRVLAMQSELNRVFPAYSDLQPDGWFGPLTAGVLAEFGDRAAADVNCPAGDREGLAQTDGHNVGPRTARAFQRYGLNL